MKVELKDPASIRKMQRMILVMERVAQLIEKHGNLEISIKIGCQQKPWWLRWLKR
ncbi:MAG: hypothetical protein ACOXZV_00590 [Bacteroidales bacterium]|jgi:hypothetical protein